MADMAPNRTNATAAAQMGKGGGTIQSNGLATPEPTPGPDTERIAADQLRQSIEISELEKVLGIKVDRRLDQAEEIKKIYLAKAPIAAKNEGDWSASWQQSHPDKEDMVDLIDIQRIEDIVVKAHFQAAKFEKDPTNARAKEQFLSRVQQLAELVEANSYPSTWILKPLPEAPKPPPSGGNGTAPTGTAPAGVIAGGITDNGTGRTDIGMDPYELNKLNAGKPGFTEDGEMIMGHKFKYFRKGHFIT
ncbi:unnamed protein product [Diplocarpon coronariae]|uniref:Uncharacterized protein n=1 Tax=Diplocarpon coronariae TaxID=2795749 RepID=A0A218ZFC9_9HELO|nr:hypothetical protein B2J93_2491 [Marssonina coronariae]